MYARSESAFRYSLGCDAACSVLCVLTCILWVPHHSQMDPDRNVPLIVLCGSQEIILCMLMGIQLCSNGLRPTFPTQTVVIAPCTRFASESRDVQPQEIPRQTAPPVTE